MAYRSRLRRTFLASALPLALAAGCGTQTPPNTGPGPSADPADGRGKADRKLYGSCEDACGSHAIEGTCWCDEYCSTYGDCCEDFDAECVSCGGELLPSDEASCAPVERIGDPIEVCSGSPRFGTPTLAASTTGFVVGCEPISHWATVERYAALFDVDGQSIAEVTTRNGPHQRQYRSPLGLYAHGGGYQLIYDYDCTSSESLETGHGQSCIQLQRFDLEGRETSAPVNFASPGWNDHPALGFDGSSLLATWSNNQRAVVRTFELDGEDGGPQLEVWPGPGALHSNDLAARTTLVWNGDGYGMFRVERTDLYFGEVSAEGEVIRPLTRVESPRYYADAFNGAIEAVYDRGRYVLLAARNSSTWPGTMDRVSLEALEDGEVVDGIEIETPLSRFPTMVHQDGRFFVFTTDGSNLVMTGIDDAFDIDEDRSAVLEMPTGYLAGKAALTADGDVLLAYIDGTWQVSSDNAVYVQRLRLAH